MEKLRENNYDLLRCVSIIAVIVIHITFGYNIFTYFGQSSSIYIINSLVRFAVPCFIMVSGAFMLSDERNKKYKYFYKKALKKILPPLIIFSVFYSIFKYLTRSDMNFKVVMLELLQGKPHYHMWYMFMLIGLYVLTPLIIRLKGDIGEKNFKKFGIIFLIFAVLSKITSNHYFEWDIGSILCYSSYYIIGYIIRKGSVEKQNNCRGILFIILGIILEIISGYCIYFLTIADLEWATNFFEPLSPTVVVGSIMIFKGFSLLNIKKDCTKISSYTFSIYLIHVAVWELSKKIFTKVYLYFIYAFDKNVAITNMVVVIIMTIIVFSVSLILSIIYRNAWKFLNKKYGISEKVNDKLGW